MPNQFFSLHCELLPSLFVRRPSVNISHFNLLLRNHWANCNQTLVEWSLGGPQWKMCPVILTSNQDGHQAKNRKKGDEIIKKSSPLKLLSQSQPSFAEIILGWSPSKIVSGISDIRPRWLPQPFRTLWEIPIKIFLSETICSIRTKFWWKSHWMVLFQNCVQRFGPLTKMAEQLNLV